MLTTSDNWHAKASFRPSRSAAIGLSLRLRWPRFWRSTRAGQRDSGWPARVKLCRTALKLQPRDCAFMSQTYSFGEVTISKGTTSIQVTFPGPYRYRPSVTVMPDFDFSGAIWIEDIDSHGFRLRLANASSNDLIFHWCAS